MAGSLGKRRHLLIDKMTIHVNTDSLSHEISYKRLREIMDGYEILLGTLEDSRTYNPNDSRTKQQEKSEDRLSHMLYLSPAVEGSYACEARLYDDSDEVNEPPLPLYGEGFDRVLRVIDCVASGDGERFEEVVPSRLARTEVLKGVEKVSPKADEKISVVVGLKQESIVELKQAEVIPFERLKPVEDKYTDAEVIGRIAQVDFEGKKLWLRPGKATKKFCIEYDSEIEDRLMEARHELMTVKCKVKYNINGDIADIIDADGIEELQLKDIDISEFEVDGVKHHFEVPITVKVELDETGQVYIATYDQLQLCVYAEHQDELRQEIEGDLEWRWSEIAMADDSELAPDALAVKRTFHELVGD